MPVTLLAVVPIFLLQMSLAKALTNKDIQGNTVQHYEVIILVDVLVDINGKAKEVKLSNPARRTSFDQLAVLKAKKNHYPIKKTNDKPVSYWQKNVEINFNPTPKN